MSLTERQASDVRKEAELHLFDVSPDKYNFNTLVLSIIAKFGFSEDVSPEVEDIVTSVANNVYRRIDIGERTGIIASDTIKPNSITPDIEFLSRSIMND